MAKNKSYSNYAEVVGNVANIYQNPAESKSGEMRFTIATHRSYEKKDGTKGEQTTFLNVLVRPGRRYAKQDAVAKGAFLRVVGHLENNAYKAEDGSYKGGMEINADKIVALVKKDDGSVEDPEGEALDVVEVEE